MTRCGDWTGLRRVNKPESPIGAMVTGQVSRFLPQKATAKNATLFPFRGPPAPQKLEVDIAEDSQDRPSKIF